MPIWADLPILIVYYITKKSFLQEYFQKKSLDYGGVLRKFLGDLPKGGFAALADAREGRRKFLQLLLLFAAAQRAAVVRMFILCHPTKNEPRKRTKGLNAP